MIWSRVAASAGLVSSLLASTVAQASDGCWSPREARAAQLRALHTKLMVGTLHCRAANDFSESAFNRFVNAQRAALDAQAAIIQARFDREHGADGKRAYDRYNTALANRYSDGSDRVDCWEIAAIADEAAEAREDDLHWLADSYARQPASGPCKPVTVASADLPAPPAKIEAIAAVTAAAPAPAEAPVAEPATIAAAAQIAPALPLEEVAPAAGASRDEALRAAVAALEAATAALQATIAVPDEAATSAPDTN